MNSPQQLSIKDLERLRDIALLVEESDKQSKQRNDAKNTHIKNLAHKNKKHVLNNTALLKINQEEVVLFDYFFESTVLNWMFL